MVGSINYDRRYKLWSEGANELQHDVTVLFKHLHVST